ncbi:MAG: hypothetical protein KBA51_06190 [Kiritimatiellae bacterium]|nr:hypothetical protein [Kiritimatiellia bacterium]
MLIWLAVGICVFAFVPRQKESNEEKASGNTVQSNQSIGNQHNAQISAGTINIYQGAPAVPPVPLKKHIRDILRTINPVIIQQIDVGAPGMAVMINQANLPDLTRLAKDPDFSNYLEMKSTGSVSMGSHNTIGGHLNDINDVGMLNGFQLIFKPSLKE